MRVKTCGMGMMFRAARVLLSFTLQASSPSSHPFLLLSMGEVMRAPAPSPACGRLLRPLIDDEPMEAVKRVCAGFVLLGQRRL